MIVKFQTIQFWRFRRILTEFRTIQLQCCWTFAFIDRPFNPKTCSLRYSLPIEPCQLSQVKQRLFAKRRANKTDLHRRTSLTSEIEESWEQSDLILAVTVSSAENFAGGRHARLYDENFIEQLPVRWKRTKWRRENHQVDSRVLLQCQTD